MFFFLNEIFTPQSSSQSFPGEKMLFSSLLLMYGTHKHTTCLNGDSDWSEEKRIRSPLWPNKNAILFLFRLRRGEKFCVQEEVKFLGI